MTMPSKSEMDPCEELTMRLILAIVVLLALTAAVEAAKHRQICRDAKTGTYVSQAYAKKYPGLTVCESAAPKK